MRRLADATKRKNTTSKSKVAPGGTASPNVGERERKMSKTGAVININVVSRNTDWLWSSCERMHFVFWILFTASSMAAAGSDDPKYYKIFVAMKW